MKRVMIAIACAILCTGVLAAQNYRDGFYFAQDGEYVNNQKNQAVLEVRGGKIASAGWNILSLNAGMQDLKTVAATGRVAAAANWATQAGVVERLIVSSQDVSSRAVNGGPANAGVFFDLARKALAGAPVGKGSYTKDGWYYGEAGATDDYHTKNTALVTVVNGRIVDLLWNGILQGMPSSINPSKMITSRGNGYPMPGAQALWHVQAGTAAAAVMGAQDPDKITVGGDGKPDAITGVSIQVKDCLDAVKQALRAAR